jgi:hypothetical protein
VQKRAAADVAQLAAVVQLPEHGDRVGGLVAVGQPQDGSPDGPVRGPVEVGLLKGCRPQSPKRCRCCLAPG